jgi:NADPH:quinone reductase-like Zn-dependent oxidoreductase
MNARQISQIPSVMNAGRLHAPGGLAGLVYQQIETPQPGAGEVLVRVHAAAIPSYEFSGIVVAIDSDGANIEIGPSAYALSAFDCDGTAADYAVVS